MKTDAVISIVKAREQDCNLLARMGSQTFIESHGRSATPEVVNSYVTENFTHAVFKKELDDANNRYHIVYYNGQPAGYSKIIFNSAHPHIERQATTKLERLYLLKPFYGLKVGFGLLQFNLELSKHQQQAGMWLSVWKENAQAVQFYLKAGFEIIGTTYFNLTETDANPTHLMLLLY